jgi:hypothetical protein
MVFFRFGLRVVGTDPQEPCAREESYQNAECYANFTVHNRNLSRDFRLSLFFSINQD